MVVAQEKIDWQQAFEEPRKQTVQPRKRRKKAAHAKQFLMLILALAITAGIGAKTVHLTVVKGAQIRELKQEVGTLEQQNELLNLKVEQMRSISRIESAALEMGMEKPAGTVYVAGTLPDIKSQRGTSAPQVASSLPEEPQTESTLKEISQLFTSFFASTQR